MADQIPPWGRAHRRVERQAAREMAKEIMRRAPHTTKFRWDITLALGVAVMAIAIVFAPPGTWGVAALWLAIMFALGIYPACHLAESVLRLRVTWIADLVGVLVLAAAVAIFGVSEWHPHRHTLSARERRSFENVLGPQKGSVLEVQIGCPGGDEKACVYAGQFVNLFGESEWKVQPLVSRLTLSKALDGVTIYRRGGNKEDMMKRWNSGGWLGINEPHLLAVQNAFRAIHIEIDGGANPDIAENVMVVYVGPEKDNEGEPTELTRATDWATGKTKGPFPKPQ
jgi:hypothetical protein